MCVWYVAFFVSDSESTEPLSIDGTSDLDEQVGEEDEEVVIPGLLEGDIPKTPDQEKFLKQHFETLASNGEKGTFAKRVKEFWF